MGVSDHEGLGCLKVADTVGFWHSHQRRKGKHEKPYVSHLVEVAMLVAEATEGKRPDLVVAALLHRFGQK
jgi:(p)ppGpp synthase/HD superfamily hydrolase